MRNILLILALVVLGACRPVTVQQVDGPVPVAVRVDDAAYWLEEWHRTINLPEEQLVLTLRTREHEFERSPDSRTRLRLALLLAEGPQPVRDQDRALELITGLDHERASDSAKALAALLSQVIEEQRWSGDKIAEMNRKLMNSETRVEELERQLQELTSIEQSIQQRELPNSRKE